jgi:hypothetical protein
MKVAKIVSMSRDLLKLLSENEVKTGDWKYLQMYEEYQCMRNNGINYRAAVMEVAICHRISRSKAERIIRRLGKELP